MKTRAVFVWTAFALAATAGGCAAHREMKSEPSASTSSHAAAAPTSGAALLAKKCGGCHAIPNPASMPEEQWVSAVERMKQRMQLSPAEWDSLTALAGAEPDT